MKHLTKEENVTAWIIYANFVPVAAQGSEPYDYSSARILEFLG
jgi:hypothetical protein